MYKSWTIRKLEKSLENKFKHQLKNEKDFDYKKLGKKIGEQVQDFNNKKLDEKSGIATFVFLIG